MFWIFPPKWAKILPILALMLKMGLLLWLANNVNRHRQNGENFMVRKVLKSQFCMLKFDKRLCFWHQSSRCYHRDERVTADKDERGQKTLLCVKSKSSHFLTNAAANPHFSNPPPAHVSRPPMSLRYVSVRQRYIANPIIVPKCYILAFAKYLFAKKQSIQIMTCLATTDTAIVLWPRNCSVR